MHGTSIIEFNRGRKRARDNTLERPREAVLEHLSPSIEKGRAARVGVKFVIWVVLAKELFRAARRSPALTNARLEWRNRGRFERFRHLSCLWPANLDRLKPSD